MFLGAVKLTKNPDPDEYFHSRYGIELYSCLLFHIGVLIAVKIQKFISVY